MESVKYIFAGGVGDVWDSIGKIELSPNLTQAELARLCALNHSSAIKVEVEKKK